MEIVDKEMKQEMWRRMEKELDEKDAAVIVMEDRQDQREDWKRKKGLVKRRKARMWRGRSRSRLKERKKEK